MKGCVQPVLRPVLILATAFWGACAFGQFPDVSVKLDANVHYSSGVDIPTTVRFYDSLAQPSTVALAFRLDQGFRVYVAERFQRIPNDGDAEQLQQYYIEDPGIWRIGKQILPFGKENLLEMTAKAACGYATLPFRYLPAEAAICDDGDNLTRGVVGRIGERTLGVSFAVGHNIGIDSTCLSVLQRPEDGLGKGRGYQQAYGMDFARRLGEWRVQAEYVTLLQGETSQDVRKDVSDLMFVLEPTRYQSFTVGWSREWRTSLDMFRVQGHIYATRSVWIEPIVRYRNGSFYDFGVSVRVKL
jgi:hypothetical protein